MRPPYVCLNCRLSCLRQVTQFRRPFSTSPRILHDANGSNSNSNSSSNRSNATHRPSTGPKPVPNIKHIRENAKRYAQNCIDRNYTSLAEYPSRIRSLANEAAHLQRSLNVPRSRIKQVERAIAELVDADNPSYIDKDSIVPPPGSFESGVSTNEAEIRFLRKEAKELKDESQTMMDRRAECLEQMQHLALALPNLTADETPVGDTPSVVGYINYDPNSPPAYTSTAAAAATRKRNHVTIGTNLGLLDFTSSATSTGWGWYYLLNEGALLEQALIQYALSVAMRRGWKPVSPPTLVYSYIAEACGFQPRDVNNEQQIWSIEQSEKDKNKPRRCLTGTAEISLAAMYAGKDIPVEKLPMKYIGLSRCYRAEAGARGVDTKGLYRVHEFTKVELFAWADNVSSSASSSDNDGNNQVATPTSSSSSSLFSEMLSIQTEILSSLGLPCRILEMPTADLGASAARKQDIETLFPSRLHHNTKQKSTHTTSAEPPSFDENGWGEVTSASICTDYQSRRLGTRVRDGSASRFPHTVNGTAVAVPRVLAAILENGWDEKLGGVVVPEVLRKWMGGIEVIKGQDKK